ncbi:hypothetical protein Pelo_10481 [Pelomyxa schiedti]|nr:hypothetical protein Pelo_10481 [Pelomyxa schiedti]
MMPQECSYCLRANPSVRKRPADAGAVEILTCDECASVFDKAHPNRISASSCSPVPFDFFSPLVHCYYPVETELLASFYECNPPICIRGRNYRTVEHWQQSKKFEGTPYELEIANALSHSDAHIMGNSSGKNKIRPDWEQVKLDLLYEATLAKFQQHRGAQQALMATKGKQLVQVDTDLFWGMMAADDPTMALGANNAAKVLMRVRDSLEQQGL